MKFQLPNRVKPAGFRDTVRIARRDLDRISDLITIMEGPNVLRVLPKIMGGAALLQTQPAVVTALTASQVAFMGPIVGLPQDPLVLALCYIPQITTITAASTTTLNFNRTDTPAVIGGTVILAATGQTILSPIFMMAVVPFGIPAVNGVSVSGANTTPAGVPTGTATQPIIFAILGLT
jgi:hypothetical protein